MGEGSFLRGEVEITGSTTYEGIMSSRERRLALHHLGKQAPLCLKTLQNSVLPSCSGRGALTTAETIGGKTTPRFHTAESVRKSDEANNLRC